MRGYERIWEIPKPVTSAVGLADTHSHHLITSSQTSEMEDHNNFCNFNLQVFTSFYTGKIPSGWWVGQFVRSCTQWGTRPAVLCAVLLSPFGLVIITLSSSSSHWTDETYFRPFLPRYLSSTTARLWLQTRLLSSNRNLILKSLLKINNHKSIHLRIYY